MKVKIINPEVLEYLYENHGQFARVCYDTPEQYAEKVGKSCQESGHMSGSRCEYIKFLIQDIDRGTAEHLMRHEIGTDVPFDEQDHYSFADAADAVLDVNPCNIVKNMASFRYIDKDGFRYVTPYLIAKYGDTSARYAALMAHINEERRSIKQMLEAHGERPKAATEDVNFVLPRATTTEFAIGFTPEALINFMYKRLCQRAAPFTRNIAILMKQEVKKLNPAFATELVPHCEHLLWCPEGKRSCGRMPDREYYKTLHETGLMEALRKELCRALEAQEARERQNDGK